MKLIARIMSAIAVKKRRYARRRFLRPIVEQLEERSLLAAIVYVDDDFTGSNGSQITDADPVATGNQGAVIGVDAFATIQAGINAVDAGGTVKVNSHGSNAAPSDVYAESVVIDKATTLDGNAISGLAVDVVIDPAAGNGISVTGANADNVTIRDLRVTGGADGINASGVDNLTITNVRADVNSDDGIDLSSITGLGVLGSIVAGSNGDDGLVGASLNTAGTFSLQNCTFSNNGSGTTTGDGVEVTNVGAVVLTSVTAIGNDPGVLISGAASFSDTDGVYSGNDNHGIQLIDITGNVTLVRTVADDNDADNDNTGDGLNATAGARPVAIGGNVLIQGARFRDSGSAPYHQERGVFIESVAGTVTFNDSTGIIRSNIVTGNEADGVVIADGGTTATFTSGTYSSNGILFNPTLDGIDLFSFSGLVSFNGVTAEFNRDSGIAINNAGSVSVTNGSASSNGFGGLIASNIAGAVTISGGTYNDNGGINGSGDGIAITFTGSASLTNVTANANGGDGFMGAGISGAVSIFGGTYNNNGTRGKTGDGIQLSTVGAITFINGVNAIGNDPGVLISDAASFSDTDGVFTDNDNHGIQLIDITGNVTLVRTVAGNNDADNDNIGDGLNATAGARPVAIGGNVLIQGARFGDSGARHQERGVFIQSVADTSTITFNNSTGTVQTNIVTGNEAGGVVVADGGATATFTNGTYSNNGTLAGHDGIDLFSFSGLVSFNGVTADSNRDSGIRTNNAGSVSMTSVSASSNGFHGLIASTIAGAVTVTGGTYNSNGAVDTNGDGIAITSAGSASLTNVTANSNSNDGFVGATIAGTVSVSGGTYNNNGTGSVTGDGIELVAVGAITFTNGVTASGNDPGVLISGAASFSDTDGVFTDNDDHGIQLIDITGNVTLVRTVADDNDADNDNIGDGLNATAGARPVAIGGNVLIQGARFRDSGGAADHQERGVFIQSVADASSITFNNSTGTVQSIIVTGNEADGVVIAAGGMSATFTNGTYSSNGGSGININSGQTLSLFDGLTLTGGKTTANSPGGGAIRASGSVTIKSSVVSGNMTTGVNARGGGIFAGGSVTVMNSTISGNSTTESGSYGGGISAGDVTITNSTISGNSTNGSNAHGGGIWAIGTVTITNSTMSGNSTSGNASHGGGVFSESLTVANSTITENMVTGANSDGGGIFTIGAVTIRNSIVAGNVDFDGSHPDLRLGGASTIQYSLIGDNTGSGLAEANPGPDANGNKIGGPVSGVLNPRLGPLANNRGPTETHALCTGPGTPHASCTVASPALNAGSNALIPADTFDLDGDGNTTEPIPFDQRGAPFNRVVETTVDMGALESQRGFPWHNFAEPFDVRGGSSIAPDGSIDAGDALAIINYLNVFDFSEAPEDAAVGQPFGFLDTNMDNHVAPDDALEVINAVNAADGEGEGWTMAPVGQESGVRDQESADQPIGDNLLALLALDAATHSPRRRK